MNLLKIEATNLDIILSFAEAIKGGGGFPKNASNVLNRVIIRVDVDCVSGFEAMAIRSISSEAVIDSMDGIKIEDRIKSLTNSGNEPTKELVELIKIFGESHEETWSVLPIGCSMFKVSATFYGPAILNFFGFDLEAFFKINDEKLSLEENVENNIAAGFHALVYKTWYSMITERDIITDSWVNSNSYNRITNEHSFILSRLIDNSSHEVSFVNTTPEELTNDIKELKGILDEFGNKVYAEIVCNTSIYTFIMLNFLIPDRKSIIDYEDLSKLVSPKESENLVPASKLIEEPVASNEWSDINMMIKEEVRNLVDIPEGSNYTLIKQLYLPASHKIKYTLRIPVRSELPYIFDINSETHELSELIKSLRNIYETYIVK